MSRHPSAETPSTWVAVLDLDGYQAAAGVFGPLGPDHEQARILVRHRRSPVGYVELPVEPENSFNDRARTAAEASFAQFPVNHEAYSGPQVVAVADGRPAMDTLSGTAFAAASDGVTIAVCTRDRTTELVRCLCALRDIDYDPLEILVVDNAPADDSSRTAVRELATADPRIRYTCERRPGLSRARNHALASATYEIVAFTDDDTVADAGWPSALVACFAADSQVVCVTGLVAAGSLQTSSERYFDARYGEFSLVPRTYDRHSRAAGLYPYSAGIVGTGANFAVRRTAIKELGGFDPQLGVGSPGRGGEDLDIFLRVLLAGGRIAYAPAALVWHRHRSDPEALADQLYSYGHGLGAYLAKHLRDPRLQAALLLHGIRKIGAVVRRMLLASRASRSGPTSIRLAVIEVRGFIAGAVSYWFHRRQSRPRHGSKPGDR